MMNTLKANVIVVRDDMVYMVQRVIANMEDKMLAQIFYDKVLEGIRKITDVDEAEVIYTSRFISVPVTIAIDEAEVEEEEAVVSVFASKLYNIISDSYKIASVLVSTDAYESISYTKRDGAVTSITNAKKDNKTSFEANITIAS